MNEGEIAAAPDREVPGPAVSLPCSLPQIPRSPPRPQAGALLSWSSLTKDRALDPSMRLDADASASRRRGARHGVSMRVTLKALSGEVLTGWVLNVSRGGLRVILDEKIELGRELEVALSTGADPVTSCIGRVVWVQEEPDGVVCGIELRDAVAREGGGRSP